MDNIHSSIDNNKNINTEGFVEPVGFNIVAQHPNHREVVSYKPEDFLVPLEIFEALNTLKEIGILGDVENRIYFSVTSHMEKGRDNFVISFRNSSSGPLNREHPSLAFFKENKGVESFWIKSLENASLETFVQLVQARFVNYDFTPVNGWRIMHYLDFVTNWHNTWSDKTIHIIDRLVTEGIPLNTIWYALNLHFPHSMLEENCRLPISWLKQAYGEKELIWQQ